MVVVFLREFTAGIRAEADGGHGRRFSGFLAHGVLELKDASDDSAIDAQGGSVDAGGEWADYQCHEVRDLLGVAQSLENGCGPVLAKRIRVRPPTAGRS
jgi:hypothetical protein